MWTRTAMLIRIEVLSWRNDGLGEIKDGRNALQQPTVEFLLDRPGVVYHFSTVESESGFQVAWKLGSGTCQI